MHKFLWIIEGFIFGILMFIVNNIIIDYFSENGINTQALPLAFLYWMIAGLAYGLIVEFFVRRKKDKNKE